MIGDTALWGEVFLDLDAGVAPWCWAAYRGPVGEGVRCLRIASGWSDTRREAHNGLTHALALLHESQDARDLAVVADNGEILWHPRPS